MKKMLGSKAMQNSLDSTSKAKQNTLDSTSKAKQNTLDSTYIVMLIILWILHIL